MLKQPEGLHFGHERWAHHAVGAVVVAYGVSPAEPRGLYWTSPDDPSGRLLSRGDRYWHCDVSRDGTLAVVDTTGPADRPGKGWDGADSIADVLLVDLFNDLGEDGTLSITRVDLGAGRNRRVSS